MPGMRIAKADQKDINTTHDFLSHCEGFWDNRNIYSIRELENSFEDWDDDNPDKKIILKIRKHIAKEEGLSENDVDVRLIVYEFLKLQYKKADANWRRVIWGADACIKTFCDPTEDHLTSSPYLEEFHVAPES